MLITHGIASMVAANPSEFSDIEIETFLKIPLCDLVVSRIETTK